MTTAPGPTSRVEREVLGKSRDRNLAQMLLEERVESRLFDSSLLFRLLRYLGPHWVLALLSAGLATIEALAMTLPAFAIGRAVDHLTHAVRAPHILDALAQQASRLLTPGAVPETLSGPATIALGFSVVIGLVWLTRWLLAVGTSYLVQKLGQVIVHDLRCGLFHHITAMDAAFFVGQPVGRLVNRTIFDVQSLQELFTDAFAQSVRDFFFLIVLIVVMLTLDPWVCLVLTAALPPLLLVGIGYKRYAREALRTNAAVQSRMNAWLAETIAGLRENQLFRAEDRRRSDFHQLTQAHQASITHVIRAWALLRPAMLMTTALVTALVLVVGSARVASGALTVGVLLTFLQYAGRIWVPVRNLAEKFTVIQAALTGAERILAVLDSQPTIADHPDADPELQIRQGKVVFDNVGFRYPNQEQPALESISFEALPGRMIALVGDTGAGKTTVARLVSRFYEPQVGKILIDDRPTEDFRLNRLRSGIALVPQEITVFGATLRENITLGSDLPEELIQRCLEATGLTSLVSRLPQGLETPLSEGGKNLSVGERQLVSFARALAANPPVLILDEATASVDSQTEQILQQALTQLTAGRTSLVIAHRLSTVRAADQILVFKAGRIVERGTHQELSQTGGEYFRLLARAGWEG